MPRSTSLVYKQGQFSAEMAKVHILYSGRSIDHCVKKYLGESRRNDSALYFSKRKKKLAKKGKSSESINILKAVKPSPLETVKV